jgi:hypothetical protein
MQNDDEDIVYMYTGYTHKLMMCFISHPTSRDKVRVTSWNHNNLVYYLFSCVAADRDLRLGLRAK